MNKPDTISIVCRDEEEINADSADLLVDIEGSSLVSGDQTFEKAAEVRELVGHLKEVGIDESNIKLRSIDIEGSAFSLLKSSSVKYKIKIGKVTLGLLPQVLGAIGSMKNCAMHRLDWNYSTAEEVRTTLRAKALKRSLAIAKQDASCLGVELLGIHELTEEFRDNRASSVSSEYASFGGRARKSKASSVDLDFALGNSSKLTVVMHAVFRVSPMNAPAAPSP